MLLLAAKVPVRRASTLTQQRTAMPHSDRLLCILCVCCCRELRLQPNAPFPLAAGLTEVSLALRPLQPGRRQYVVHAVDLARRALLASWLVCAVNRLPAVTKSFSLTIPAALGARKKVSLANPYSYDTTYKFYSDQVCGRVSCVVCAHIQGGRVAFLSGTSHHPSQTLLACCC